MRFKGIYFLISSIFLHSIGYSQNDNQVNSRNAIFDRLEARAKSLASRMDEMAGNANTEQTGVNSPIPSSSVPLFNQEQEARSEEPSIPNPSNGSPTETSVSPNSAFTVVDNSEDFLPPPTVQELNGDYYILPSFGFVLSSESKVNINYQDIDNKNSRFNVVKDLDNEMGYVVGMRAGIRFSNIFTEFGIKYSSFDYKATGIVSNLLGNTINLNYDGVGSAGILNFNAKLGYSFPLNDVLSFNSSFGFGVSNRRNDIDIGGAYYNKTASLPFSYSISSSETVLSYDLAFSIAYYHSESYLISLGYNYMNVAKISQFDALDLHYFELGLGLNF